MSLIEAVSPILGAKTARVTLDIAAHPSKAGEFVVIVKPVVGVVPDSASEEMKQLMAALAMPLKVTGEAADIERELTEVISRAASHRDSWEDRALEITASIKAARTEKPATQAPAEPEKAPVSDTDSAAESGADKFTL